MKNPSRVQSNFGHLGIEVESQDEMMRRLEIAREQGIVSKEEIGTACCYALQDKYWVNDPDGVQWEIYYFHQDSEFNDPKYQSGGEEEVCCAAPAEKEAKVEEGCCEPGTNCC